MNQAHGRRDGINWATVALYGGGAAVGVGATKAAIRGGKNAWSKHNVTTKLNRIAGLPSRGMAGANRAGYTQAGADFLGRMTGVTGRRAKEMAFANPKVEAARQNYAVAQNQEKAARGTLRHNLNKGNNTVNSALSLSRRKQERAAAGAAFGDLYGREMRSLSPEGRSSAIMRGRGYQGSAMRGVAAATGWLGAFDYAGGGMKRAGVAGARAGMVGLGMKAAGAGLGWLFD